MNPLKAAEIYGNWATLLLPIEPDESIHFDKLAAEIDFLVAAKVDGIYSCGTAGEFYNITEDEFDRANALLTEKCNTANMPFQIGVGHMSPITSLNRLNRAVSFKPSAVQVILPDWFKVTMDEAVAYLSKMGDMAGPIGIVLYNPPHSKWVLDPEELGALKSAVPNLVGLKVAGGDTNWYDQMKHYGKGLSIFIPGHFLASGRNQGAHGAYSNMACLHPLAAQKWYELTKNDMKAALELENRIQQFLNQYIVPLIIDEGYPNQAVDKFMAVLGGWSDVGSRLRWPYRWIDADRGPRIRKAGKNIIPEFFE